MKKQIILIIFAVILLQFSGFIHAAIPASERAALIALYNSTNGDNWINNMGWKTPPLHTDGFAMPGTELYWLGINGFRDHVTCIEIYENQLSGSIPSQLGNLSQLNTLILDFNQLSGSIPSQLGNLSNMDFIELSSNQLSGSIPPQLGNLTGMRYLELNNNQLSGNIPSQLGNLNNLRTLRLANNQLSGNIPSQLGNLSRLDDLSLNGNQLSGSIPYQLGNLNNLRTLRLDNNQLSGNIPSQLGNLSNLRALWININQLSGNIPYQLGNLSNLLSLLLDNNQLSGGIPYQLGNLSQLQYLHLYNNQLSGSIPSQLSNLSNLYWLYLNNNQLSGSIPSSFTNLSKITSLNIGYNCLYATDPTLRAWLDSHDPDWEAHQDQCGGGTIPTVTTNSVSLITSTSAVCGGNVTSDGGTTVTARGVCWSTTSNPTTGNSKTTDGSGTGSFSSSITGLNPGTIYYSRAYATNSMGTSYGSNKSFTTESSITYTLTIKSSPSNGAVITVSPNDTNSQGNGTTTFTRIHNGGTTVTLTAPSMLNEKSFSRWSIDGKNYFSTSVQVTISSNKTATAYYINSSPPEISLNRPRLNFGYVIGVNTPGSQDILISNKGGATLNWTLSTAASWLDISPMSGTGSGVINVSIDPTGLTVGTYAGLITVTDPNAANSPQAVSVNLKVKKASHNQKPFGEFATPIDGSVVYNSIPVTGWALDDIEIEGVKIYRIVNGQYSYIGEALFVEGARPDVEQAFPDYPLNYKAGWGYMLLTNSLPDGRLDLIVIVKNKAGGEITLGTRTLTIDNANAIKPFGAIDFPAQGGTASGSYYMNWGWVLTPQPNMIPTDGTTIDVWVDGVKLGHPTYNIYNPSLADFFPGYANSNGAAGYFTIDTTTYTNGVHSIFWTAADNVGNEDGIGSRYFTIQNTGNSRAASANREKTVAPGITDLIDIPISYVEPVELQKGYTYNYSTEEVYPDPAGNIYIQCKELERIEIQVTRTGMDVEGYLAVGSRLMDLPVGSTLEKKTGRFSWIPGPGFVGTYRLVFVETNGDGEKSRKNILVTIDSKFTRE